MLASRLAVLLAAALAFACAAAPPREPVDTGMLVLWEVESARNDAGRAWLLGSVHIARPELRLDPHILAAFEASEALVLEIDVEEADPARMQRMVANRALLPDGETLEDVLDAKTWNRLAGFLRDRGMPPEAVRYYEPWFVLTIVSTELFAESGADAGAGIEVRLLDLVDGDKRIVALESAEFQLELLSSVPRPLVASMLAEMLSDEDRARETGVQLLDAWEAGDLQMIHDVALGDPEGDADLAEFQERTFFARNRAMAERLDELLAEPRTWFVAIGAAHMTGDQGVPALLGARGHRVTRIPRSPGE